MEVIDKRIVVTGAASGIGKALSIAFKEAGAKSIVCADMNIEGAEETAALVGGLAVKVNVANEDEVISLIAKANKFSGGIDIFCSNAGIIGIPGVFDTTTEDWQNIWEINVLSHIHAAKHVLPQMLERGEGYLMNTASAAGLLTQIGASGYAVTKAAAVSFAEWIKITYGHKGIGVSCLCPQAVKTPMIAQGAGVAGVDGLMEPEEVAADVIEAIKEERFLVTPHTEVLEYVARKGNDRDRWIKGMQRLQERFEDWVPNSENTDK